MHPNDKARELLFSVLTPEQRRDYLSHGEFIVYGRRHFFILQRRRYTIRHNGTVRKWCVSVKGAYELRENYLPEPDQVLALKLWIEGRERAFRKEANATWMFWRIPREIWRENKRLRQARKEDAEKRARRRYNYDNW